MNCPGTDIIELDILDLSPLAIAAMKNTPGTQQLNGNRFAINLDKAGARSWEKLLSKKRGDFSVGSMIANKEHEYVQLCLLDLYIEQLIPSDRYQLSLDSWSADVGGKVDAILKIDEESFYMDFTLNPSKLNQKLNHSSGYNKSDWIAYFQIKNMRGLKNTILNEYKGEYDRASLTKYLRSMKHQPCKDINIYDRDTKVMPYVLEILGNKL